MHVNVARAEYSIWRIQRRSTRRVVVSAYRYAQVIGNRPVRVVLEGGYGPTKGLSAVFIKRMPRVLPSEHCKTRTEASSKNGASTASTCSRVIANVAPVYMYDNGHKGSPSCFNLSFNFESGHAFV